MPQCSGSRLRGSARRVRADCAALCCRARVRHEADPRQGGRDCPRSRRGCARFCIRHAAYINLRNGGRGGTRKLAHTASHLLHRVQIVLMHRCSRGLGTHCGARHGCAPHCIDSVSSLRSLHRHVPHSDLTSKKSEKTSKILRFLDLLHEEYTKCEKNIWYVRKMN